MKKIRKWISALLVCAVLAAALSGCYESVDTTIHADGSGTTTVFFGVTEEERLQMSDEDSAELTPREVDGVTYYGTEEEESFSSVEEFNEMFSDFYGLAVLLESENGGLTLTLDSRPSEEILPEYGEDDEDDWTYEEFEWTEERVAERKKMYLDCFRARATGGFSDYDLYTAATHLAKKSADYSDAEFAYVIDYWTNDATVEYLNSYIWDMLDDIRNYPEYIHYPLTKEKIAARRAEIEATLDELSISLTAEDKAFYTEVLCHWYGEYYTDAEFKDAMRGLRTASEEDLREFFDYLDEYYRRPLTEAQIAARRAAIEALTDELAIELSEVDRAYYIEVMCGWYDEWYTDAEFEDAMTRLRGMDAEELLDWLDDIDDGYEYSLTAAQVAARRAAIEALLNELSIELTEEDKAFYTESMSDWYDEYYTDAEFAMILESMRAMDEDELRDELNWFDYYYDRSSSSSGDAYEDATLIWTVRFDTPVSQIEGPADGVSIKNGTLTLNLTALAEDLYRFTTRTDTGLAYEHGQAVEVDGVPVTLSCYAIRSGGYETNYVRIRELAEALNGTPAQFDVSWSGAVAICSGAAYSGSTEPVPFSGEHLYTAGGFETSIDGSPAELDAITLNDADGNGYTYYKLRDLGSALGFNVRWDAARSTVCIETDRPYSAED